LLLSGLTEESVPLDRWYGDEDVVRVVEGSERVLVEWWEWISMGTNTEATITSNDTALTDVATGGDGKFDMERMKMMSSVFHLVVMMVMLMMTGSAFYLTMGCFLSLETVLSDEDDKLWFSLVDENFLSLETDELWFSFDGALFLFLEIALGDKDVEICISFDGEVFFVV